MNSKKLRSSKKGRMHPPPYVYLVYLLVCTFLLTSVSFSRYISSANGSDSAQVATGVVEVSHDEVVSIVMDKPTNDEAIETRRFSFSVSNKGSEVAIRYDLELTLSEALPSGVTISLYKNGDSDRIGTFDNRGETRFAVSNAGIFEAGKKKTDTYTLEFVGDFDQIADSYDGTVSISVKAEQID